LSHLSEAQTRQGTCQRESTTQAGVHPAAHHSTLQPLNPWTSRERQSTSHGSDAHDDCRSAPGTTDGAALVFPLSCGATDSESQDGARCKLQSVASNSQVRSFCSALRVHICLSRCFDIRMYTYTLLTQFCFSSGASRKCLPFEFAVRLLIEALTHHIHAIIFIWFNIFSRDCLIMSKSAAFADAGNTSKVGNGGNLKNPSGVAAAAEAAAEAIDAAAAAVEHEAPDMLAAQQQSQQEHSVHLSQFDGAFFRPVVDHVNLPRLHSKIEERSMRRSRLPQKNRSHPMSLQRAPSLPLRFCFFHEICRIGQNLFFHAQDFDSCHESFGFFFFANEPWMARTQAVAEAQSPAVKTIDTLKAQHQALISSCEEILDKEIARLHITNQALLEDFEHLEPCDYVLVDSRDRPHKKIASPWFGPTNQTKQPSSQHSTCGNTRWRPFWSMSREDQDPIVQEDAKLQGRKKTSLFVYCGRTYHRTTRILRGSLGKIRA
jgi:hypothetical protein